MRLIKSLAKNPLVKRAVVESPQAQEVVSKYIAGADIDSAIEVAKTLNGHGLGTVLTLIGAGSPDVDQVAAHTSTYLRLIEELRGSPENQMSVSPELLGLNHGINSARPQVRKVVLTANQAGVPIVLDMAEKVDATIQLFRELLPDAPGLGITLQARLTRTFDDCRKLAQEGARIRLCKGAKSKHGYRREQDAALSYVRCLRVLMESAAYPIVATHDPRLVPIAQELAERTERTPADYEFQMLYGFRPIEQRRLVDTGYQCRVSLPFGQDWYDYLSLGVAARPNVWVRSLWAKR